MSNNNSKQITIDITPKFVALLRLVSAGANPDILLDGCRTLDFIQDAKKNGAKSVIITFSEDGHWIMDDGLGE